MATDPSAEKQYEVGEELVTECKRCDSDMYHVVVALKEDVVHRVMCKGCNHTHVIRKKKKAAAKKSTASGDAPKKRTVTRRKKDWGTLTSDITDEELIDYNMEADFTEAKGMRHKKFGVGAISIVLSDTQIEVVFQDAIKILVHNYE